MYAQAALPGPQLQSEQLIFYTERRHRAAIGASLEVMIL